MKMSKKELKVFYEGELNPDLDLAIKKTLKKFGYKLWASGMDLLNPIRDLAFDKKE